MYLYIYYHSYYFITGLGGTASNLSFLVISFYFFTIVVGGGGGVVILVVKPFFASPIPIELVGGGGVGGMRGLLPSVRILFAIIVID